MKDFDLKKLIVDNLDDLHESVRTSVITMVDAKCDIGSIFKYESKAYRVTSFNDGHLTATTLSGRHTIKLNEEEALSVSPSLYPEKLYKTPLSSEFVRTYKQLLQHSDKMNKLDAMQNNIDIGKKRTGEAIEYLVERTQAIL